MSLTQKSGLFSETPIFRSLEIIESRITEKLSVEDIADGVYLSKYHYMRRFRETVGGSVMAYVTKRKLTLAGKALLETASSVLDIALDFGYESRNAFTRSFKAHTGVTPSEYRRYGLAASSQNTVKERMNMRYSKTTDGILREMNEFIAKSKETAAAARGLESPAKLFWTALADKLDLQAESLKAQLARVSAIPERSDEITKRFQIVEAIEGTSFNCNILLTYAKAPGVHASRLVNCFKLVSVYGGKRYILALNAGLTAARSQPEDAEPQRKLAAECRELANSARVKSRKIKEFLNELAALIFDDMRKEAAEKIRLAVSAGRAAARRIKGHDYIRNEVQYAADALDAKPVEELTAGWIEDCLFKLRIILSTAELQDVPRNPADGEMFGGIAAFIGCLQESFDFFGLLLKDEPAAEPNRGKMLSDIAYQSNILLFFLRGEAERLEPFLDGERKSAFKHVDDGVNEFVSLAHNATEETESNLLAEKLRSIGADIAAQAGILGERGGAVGLLAGEFHGLAHALRLKQF